MQLSGWFTQGRGSKVRAGRRRQARRFRPGWQLSTPELLEQRAVPAIVFGPVPGPDLVHPYALNGATVTAWREVGNTIQADFALVPGAKGPVVVGLVSYANANPSLPDNNSYGQTQFAKSEKTLDSQHPTATITVPESPGCTQVDAYVTKNPAFDGNTLVRDLPVVPPMNFITPASTHDSPGNTSYAFNTFFYLGGLDTCPVPPCAPGDVSAPTYLDMTNPFAPVSLPNLQGGNLAGHTIQVTFSTPTASVIHPTEVTLVSYNAGGSLSDQTVYQAATQTFVTPGPHTLTVKVPTSSYQIDFVCGEAITQFNPGQNVTYHGEHRFIDSGSGGPVATVIPPDGGGDCGDRSRHLQDGGESTGCNQGGGDHNNGGGGNGGSSDDHHDD